MDYLIDVETTVTEKMYHSLVYFQTFMTKRSALFFNVIAGVVSLGNVLAKWFGIYEPGPFLYYASLLFLALVIVSIPVMELQIRNFIKTDRTVVGHSHRLQVGEEEIASTVGNAHVSYTWDKLYRVYENKWAFLFYINAQQAIVLPKEEITPQQRTALREMAERKLDRKFMQYCK